MTDEELHQVKMGSLPGSNYFEYAEAELQHRDRCRQAQTAMGHQSRTVQTDAFRMLRAIYDRTHDQTNPVDDVTRLNIGLTEEESRVAWRYLRDKGFIQTFNLAYAARINGRGVDAIENAQRYPDQPSPGFPSVTYNTFNVGTMTAINSPIQQAGAQSTQSQSSAYGPQDLSNLTRLVTEFTAHFSELNLDARQKQKADAQLATLKAQLTDDPDPVILRQAGRTLRNITEGAIGSLLATAAQPTIWLWISQAMAELFA